METITLAFQGCVKIKLNNTFGELVIEFSIENHKFTILGQNGGKGLASLCAILQEGDENPSANSSSIHRKKRHRCTHCQQVVIYTTSTTALGLSFVWLVSLLLSTSMLKGSLVRQVFSLVAI